MHSIHVNSEALVRAVVPALIEEGYAFARLDQLPAYRQYETPPQNDQMGIADARAPQVLARLTAVK